MLRITRSTPEDDKAHGGLIIEGRLVGPWVDVLREECRARREESGSAPVLEAAGVTFADAAGLELLRELHDQGIATLTCSSFLRHLIADACGTTVPGAASHSQCKENPE